MTDATQTLTPEREFASNLSHILESRGISQVALARSMADEGFPWRQATVWAVLVGERKLRLDEAVGVSSLLDVPLMAMLGADSPLVPRSTARAVRIAEQMRVLAAELEGLS